MKSGRRVKRISKKTNYKIGRNFEYRVKRYYEKLGYYVIRSYASKGAADLYCMKPTLIKYSNTQNPIGTELLLVQCKNYKGKLKEYEYEALRAMSQMTGGTPIHVYKDKERKLRFVPIPRQTKETLH